jgi:hypothetical protein
MSELYELKAKVIQLGKTKTETQYRMFGINIQGKMQFVVI